MADTATKSSVAKSTVVKGTAPIILAERAIACLQQATQVEIEDLDLLVERLRVLHRAVVPVLHVGAPAAAEARDVGELVQVLGADLHRLPRAHREAGDRAAVAVGHHAVVLFDVRADVLGEVLLERVGPEACLLYTSPSPRDPKTSRMPSSA